MYFFYALQAIFWHFAKRILRRKWLLITKFFVLCTFAPFQIDWLEQMYYCKSVLSRMMLFFKKLQLHFTYSMSCCTHTHSQPFWWAPHDHEARQPWEWCILNPHVRPCRRPGSHSVCKTLTNSKKIIIRTIFIFILKMSQK